MRIVAVVAALSAFALDVGAGTLMRAMPQWNGVTIVPGLLDLHYFWNYGVSFSLLAQNGTAGRAILILCLAVIVAGCAVLAWRAEQKLAAAGLGLIVGGALGNLYGRILYGAVFDFLALHLGAFPLFVCNTADTLITVGVLCLAADMVRPARAR